MFLWSIILVTTRWFANMSSFCKALSSNAMSLPVTICVALLLTDLTTFSATPFKLILFLHWTTVFWCLWWITVSYSIMILSFFPCFSKLSISAFESWSSIANLTGSSMTLQGIVWWRDPFSKCPSSNRHGSPQANAGLEQPYLKQKMLALLLVIGQTGFPYEIIRLII